MGRAQGCCPSPRHRQTIAAPRKVILATGVPGAFVSGGM